MKLISVEDNNGTVYTNDMSDENKHTILEIHFCTSYTYVRVQDEIITNGTKTYPTKDIIIDQTINGKANVIDFLAIKASEIGKWR